MFHRQAVTGERVAGVLFQKLSQHVEPLEVIHREKCYTIGRAATKMKMAMACPYFYPVAREFGGGWAFPARLPLGAGFRGTCHAGGNEFSPGDAALRDCCNLGHAQNC